MKIVVAMDSFKGSLSSLEAGEAAALGIREVYPDARIVVRPLADGGEGTVDALVPGLNGQLRHVTVTGPAGRPVCASYGIIQEKKLAVMGMASAAGLTLVPENKRNPMITTTYGVGEMILDAVAHGCRRFMIGLGGSGTNDGGAGMLMALGYGFLDREGRTISFGAAGLERLAKITKENVKPELSDCEFMVACDVANVLCGPDGCSAVYGPQKGANQEMIEYMDGWLSHYADLAAEIDGRADPGFPGAGAAGGMGFAFKTFLNARLEPGVSIVLRETSLEEEICGADIVVTGEGCIDGQTAMGKAPAGAAALAKKHGVPVVALAGCVAGDAKLCNGQGIDAFFSILPRAMDLNEAMEPETAKKHLEASAVQVFRLWKTACQRPGNPLAERL